METLYRPRVRKNHWAVCLAGPGHIVLWNFGDNAQRKRWIGHQKTRRALWMVISGAIANIIRASIGENRIAYLP